MVKLPFLTLKAPFFMVHIDPLPTIQPQQQHSLSSSSWIQKPNATSTGVSACFNGGFLQRFGVLHLLGFHGGSSDWPSSTWFHLPSTMVSPGSPFSSLKSIAESSCGHAACLKGSFLLISAMNFATSLDRTKPMPCLGAAHRGRGLATSCCFWGSNGPSESEHGYGK